MKVFGVERKTRSVGTVSEHRRRRGLHLLSAVALLGTGSPGGSPRAVVQTGAIDAAVAKALSLATMRVDTLAGSGDVGNANGESSVASFVQPAGLLWDARSKTLFVSDLSGQRIRSIVDGRVSTVAGAGTLDRTTFKVTGGYLDGAASTARFDGPEGMAIDASGALMVADSENGVVRRIMNGRVSTSVGRQGDTVGADGPPGVGSLHRPVALDYGTDGSLYIADYGVGLRRVARDGTISTVFKAPDVLSVSVVKRSTEDIAWFGTFGGLHRLNVVTSHEDRWDKADDTGSTHTRFGAPFQMIGVNADAVIYSDLESNTVKYFHEPDHYIGALNSDDSSDDSLSGGFRDGPYLDAKANAPMGIALLSDGRVAFADSGDGRIRAISNFSARSATGADPASVASKRDAKIERIAVVGDSYVASNVLWNDSISGILQNGLNAVAPPPGKERFVVDAFRISNSTLAAQADFITNYLGAYDGVIFLATDFGAGGYPKLLGSDFADPDYAKLGALFAKTASSLKEDGTFLEVAAEPLGFEVAPWERSLSRVENLFYGTRSREYERLVQAARVSGVPTIDVGRAFSDRERRRERQALYSPYDWHLSRAGNIAAGEILLRSTLALKPWASGPQPR